MDVQLAANLVPRTISILLESFVVTQSNVLDGNAADVARVGRGPQQGDGRVGGGLGLVGGATRVFGVEADRWRPVGAEFDR